MLDKFAGAITRRETAMLEYLKQPHTLDEMVETRAADQAIRFFTEALGAALHPS